MKTGQKPYEPKSYDHLEDVTTNACSSTECTGLIAHAPLTEEEFESYMEIYEFGPRIVADKRDEEGVGPAYGSDHTEDSIQK